jgi:hypothetical protein
MIMQVTAIRYFHVADFKGQREQNATVCMAIAGLITEHSKPALP